MPADVPAPVQPGPEPDRERLQQAQAPPPASGGAHRGRAVGGHRPAARPVLPARVPELLPTLRIHTNRHTILKSALDHEVRLSNRRGGDGIGAEGGKVAPTRIFRSVWRPFAFR